MRCPHSDSISATDSCGNTVRHPPVEAFLTNGLSCRVYLVCTHFPPSLFSSWRMRSAELNSAARRNRSGSGLMSNQLAIFASCSCVLDMRSS